jgi:hypothetical protein
MFGLSDIALKLIIAGVGALAFTGLIGGGIHHIRTQADRAGRPRGERSQVLKQAKKDAEEVRNRRKQKRKKLSARELAAGQARTAAMDEGNKRFKNEMRTLQARDPVVREWAAVPVPPTVVACVLGLADCAAGRDQSNGTNAAAEVPLQPTPEPILAIDGNDERGPGRVWSGLRYRGQGVQRGQGGDAGMGAQPAADSSGNASR